MRLYIAEKPSMAAEIAKHLPGPMAKRNGYFETGGGLVTWLYGHVLRMAEPGEYDARFEKWALVDLPIVPMKWHLVVSESSKAQFDIVAALIDRASEIIHAGDPDREGQLLVDEVLEFVGNRKPVKRLLLNALDEKSVRAALADLRDNNDFAGLMLAALARQRADWLIGMNVTRLATLCAQVRGYGETFPVGRVKTPTLSLVVRREREIAGFKPVEHYGFKAEFSHHNGSFTAGWRAKETQPGLDSEGRLVDLAAAGELKRRFLQKGDAEITGYETKEKSRPQPLPFSLSALQVAAGKRFGYSPQVVLEAAQALYEKKLTTYPRSDCDYLPENQLADAPAILAHLAGLGMTEADASIRSRAWDDSKISSHHAIIPTVLPCEVQLPETEQDVYNLIAVRYIAQFYPAHVFDQTSVALVYQGEEFRTSGRVIKEPGWRKLYAAEDEDKEEKAEEDAGVLPAMKPGDSVSFINMRSLKKTTKPPERFTESTLLQAMKEIHRFVKNDELKKQLKSVSGIGTEATRAGIIADLIEKQFMELEKKRLKPTEIAFILVDALPDELTFPDSTAVWEDQLKLMEEGAGILDEFITRQVELVKRLCKSLTPASFRLKEGGRRCPTCKEGVLICRKGGNGPFWGCSRYPDCKFTAPDRMGKPDLLSSKLGGLSRITFKK